MKKTYFTPALVAVKIESMQLMSGSPSPIDTDPTDNTINQYSNKYQGPAGGFLWEDDNAE